MAIWRPGASSVWWVLGGQAGTTTAFGQTGDIPVPADYDGDGLTDLAFYRPSDGTWSVIMSATGRIETVQWGMPGDIPLPADYHRDGKVQFAVYRPSTGSVYVRLDGCGTTRTIAIGNGTPIVGDFDGDGAADPGIFDPSTGEFQIHLSATPLFPLYDHVTPYFLRFWAPPSYQAVTADFDGDGITDLAVFDATSATWYYRASTTGQVVTTRWGSPGDKPVAADYDGDGKADLATWTDATGMWTIRQSSTGAPQYQQWGYPGDVPVPAR
jgi:hypothetical protein